MTQLEHLARMPDPAYETLQFSSYDRSATDPAVQTDENWYANGDRGKHLREEERNGEKEWVMLDAEGPGAIVRFWSANPADAGIVRIYLDGSDTPVIEMALTELLGAISPFTPEPIGGVRGAGWNSYLPIPYAKHCKVTASQPDFYYILNYRKYAAGVQVETLTAEKLEAGLPMIESAAKALKALSPSNSAKPARHSIDVGETVTLAEQTGAGVVTELLAHVDAKDLEIALRTLVLSITFDGKETVNAPLGDFFGTAPGLNAFESLPVGTSKQLLYARWPMPYKETMQCRVTNHGKESVTLEFAAEVNAQQWKEDTLHFHAKWRTEADIPTRPRQDWNYATITGRGRFVGTILHMANPVKDWWGEGDEKIYIDGATFPQWFGTGSEDYYGYAWCDNHVFSHAYHNQPRVDGPGNYGHTCVSRFLIMDNIPFQKSLQFDMEVWHWKETKVTQSAMSYWYADAASTDNFSPIDPKSLYIPKLPALPLPKAIKGAIEGEKMRVVSREKGQAWPQKSDMWDWSAGEQMWWFQAAPGDTLVLGFNVPKAGDYEVLGVFTKAPDYAIGTVQVNDAPASEPIDFYHTEVVPTDPPLSLGVHQLTRGENTLKLTITGANENAIQNYMMGVDCLLLKPVKK